jgi:threonine/homoserine/homoserine lactone efflux protein
MPSPSTLLVFAGAALVLCAIPGPAVLYIVTRGVESGRRAALTSVLGIHVGSCVHITAAVVGLSALLMSSAAAFTAIKYVGAAYLIALGLQRLLRGSGHIAPGERAAPELGPVFRQAIVVESLNPKTALFFLAFLPQFVDPTRAVAPQIAVLGLVWLVVGLFSDATWGLLAGSLGDVLRRSSRFPIVERYVAGGALIGLGVVAAFTGRRAAHAR